MKKNIKTNRKEKTVSITITIPKRRLATDPILQVRTRDAVNILKEEGISFKNECIKEATVTNEKENSDHSGTWVFPLIVKEEKAKPAKKTTTSRPKHKTSTKTVKSAVEDSAEAAVFAEKNLFSTKALDKTPLKWYNSTQNGSKDASIFFGY